MVARSCVAGSRNCLVTLWWGTITTCIPAASPAVTPLGASSNTRQEEGSGHSVNLYRQSAGEMSRLRSYLEAHTENISGEGLDWETSHPVTT